MADKISIEKASKFTPLPNMKSWFMMDARRMMTSLTGSLSGMNCRFIVDQDIRSSELFDVFYSDYFLSAVEKAVLDTYPQAKGHVVKLKFSGETGLNVSQRELLADQSVGVFIFCMRSGKLVATVPKNKLRHVALQFLTSDTYKSADDSKCAKL
jgi:hypothetical protein